MPTPRPVLNDRFESSVPGIYVIGDLAGAPVVKLAMEQGYHTAHQIAKDLTPGSGACYDVLIAGSGAAGLNAALELQHLGLRVVVIEKGQFASTVAELPEGKWIYAEPTSRPPVGRLWLEETTKESLVERWAFDAERAGLNVRTGEAVTAIRRESGVFRVSTTKTEYTARRVVLAIGKAGSPKRLEVPGEDQAWVQHRLFQTSKYKNERIVVVGGGNSAVEAAVALSKENRVLLSYRGPELIRVTRENRKQLDEAVGRGSLEFALNTRVTSFRNHSVTLDDGRECAADHAFVLIGSEPPKDFLRSLGIRLENDWTGRPWIAGVLAACAFAALGVFGAAGAWVALAMAAGLLSLSVRGDRFALAGFSFLTAYSIYGLKQAPGHEFWPFTGWGAGAMIFFDRPWSFWYTVLYTAVMTIFGIQAMKRWGLSRNDKFQIWRYASLLGFQWVFFFLIPEFLFRWAVEYQWITGALATDPNFAENAWRSYGIVYAWPLFFYTFFGAPHQVWLVWGVLLSFVIIPVLALFHGKRYCSWICGCGGLAETLGDRWRHLAPKGAASIRWERMNAVVLAAAVAITILVVTKDVITVFRSPAQASLAWYRLIADVWLVGILPVALYPFMGGKVWCRYWCPLAKMMELFSAFYTRFNVSRFAIRSNEKCIACGDCTRNCQVGIDVMRYALKQEDITNSNSSCIGCGICVTVCPMNVLAFATPQPEPKLVQITRAA